jgi:hypothetical protein
MVLFIGQLSGRKSLLDLAMNVSARSSKLYHLASASVPAPPWPGSTISMQQMLRPPRLNLCERRDCWRFFKSPGPQLVECRRFFLFWKP